MPIFDTPITTDDAGLPRVLAQPLPVALLLFDSKVAPPLDEALTDLSGKNAGKLLVVRVDVSKNIDIHTQYNSPIVPALLTLTPGESRSVKSRAERVSASDIRAHVRHLLEDTPLPEKKSTGKKNNSERRSGKPSGKSAPAKPIEVTDRSFSREVLKSDVPVLVDFWAPWCGPCRAIAPHIEQIARQYAGKVKVVKLNTDMNQRTAQQFGIRSIPTFMVFNGGKPVDRFVGADPNALRRAVSYYAK